MSTVLLLNGPNLNLLDSGKTELYSKTALKDFEKQVSLTLRERKIECLAFHSNSEQELINWLDKRRDAEFLLLNPGALTNKSIKLRNTLLEIEIPFLEIKLSNTHKHEEFQHHSCFSDIAIGSLVGLGIKGYLLAAQFAVDYLEQMSKVSPND
ncbi:MAG TPA: 3-dehydroquinate dehydratase [Deltaproteobacteria bacterium]|nr:3-dehydroquinate dehydratase [Deltaproteobacteria bacterium]|tara:strand:- start:639 stop:1097 length:459 start_codon:yes stop_codon:yes gene_type:complete